MRDVAEADVEPAELVADHDEHAERLDRVLDLGKEARREAERERDLGRLVEVRLEDVPVGRQRARGLRGARTC